VKKVLLPLLIALLGLGAGVGAGLALKPAPTEDADAHIAEPCPKDSEAPCELAEGMVEPMALAPKKPEGELAYVPIEKPFVVPVFQGEKVVAMVVVTLSVEVGADAAQTVETVLPRMRDSFLKVMFRHANSGGFDGSFTSGQPMQDLKSALVVAARAILPEAPLGEILITDIARQDV
jgi:flagellar protein FliL